MISSDMIKIVNNVRALFIRMICTFTRKSLKCLKKIFDFFSYWQVKKKCPKCDYQWSDDISSNMFNLKKVHRHRDSKFSKFAISGGFFLDQQRSEKFWVVRQAAVSTWDWASRTRRCNEQVSSEQWVSSYFKMKLFVHCLLICNNSCLSGKSWRWTWWTNISIGTTGWVVIQATVAVLKCIMDIYLHIDVSNDLLLKNLSMIFHGNASAYVILKDFFLHILFIIFSRRLNGRRNKCFQSNEVLRSQDKIFFSVHFWDSFAIFQNQLICSECLNDTCLSV